MVFAKNGEDQEINGRITLPSLWGIIFLELDVEEFVSNGEGFFLGGGLY
jgi:hypothetical protein